MDPKTDKKRLSQVQTQDLTESRLNDDFVYWLKKNGTNTLLVVLIALCAFLGFNFWQRKNLEKTSVAWSELGQATLPEAFEQIAKDHADIPQAAMMALLSAADLRLRQLQSGVLVAEVRDAQGTVTTPAVALDDAGRKVAQDAAEENYSKAADIALKLAGNNSNNAAIVLLQSYFGRAAVAESRGNFDGAKQWLTKAETEAGTAWAPIAKLAKSRIDGLVALATPMQLPKNADLPVKAQPPANNSGPAGATDLFQQVIQEQQKAGETPAPTTPGTTPDTTPGKTGG